MINSVRNTVLSVLNKNNYGYIGPSDFNLFAKQAQLDIFKDYFQRYNNQITKENSRVSGTGYADLKKRYLEVIERFSETSPVLTLSGESYQLPSDFFAITNVVISYPSGKWVEAEKVPKPKVVQLMMSNLTQPVPEFPMYVESGTKIQVYPSTSLDVFLNYIRYPKTPKWTYSSIGNGEPLYNPNQPDFQDFEVPSEDETVLVVKILKYAGVSIRETEVANFSIQEEQKDMSGYVQQL
jgi:hypothetical protein